MIKINLIGEGKRPAAVRKRREIGPSLRKENLANYLLVAGLVAGLIPLGVEWWLLKSRLEQREEQIAELEVEYERLKPIIEKVNKFKATQAELERKIEVINQLKLNQKGPVRVMDNVSRALPELVWLTQMEVQAKTIKLVGQARNENAVATFIDNLDQSEGFQEPTLRHMRGTRGGVYSFEIVVAYSLTAPKPPVASAADGAAENAAVGG